MSENENIVKEEAKDEAITLKKKIVKQKKTETESNVKKSKKIHKKLEAVYFATGRRKTAIATIRLSNGSGVITINGKPYIQYFCKRPVLLATLLSPLKEMNFVDKFDIKANVKGGGVSAQADAVRLGIARALIKLNPELRPTLRSLDLLRRDPRMKERKKYGLKRARRAFQYTKR